MKQHRIARSQPVPGPPEIGNLDVSYPMLKQLGFPRRLSNDWSYLTGVDFRSSYGICVQRMIENVNASIGITIMKRTATLATPLSIRELESVVDRATSRAALGAWKPAINLLDNATIPFLLVFEQANKLRPSHVADCFGKFVILQHARHI